MRFNDKARGPLLLAGLGQARPQGVVHHTLQREFLLGHALADLLRHVGLDGQRRPHKDIIIPTRNDVKTSTRPVDILAVGDGRQPEAAAAPALPARIGHGRDPRSRQLAVRQRGRAGGLVVAQDRRPLAAFQFLRALAGAGGRLRSRRAAAEQPAGADGRGGHGLPARLFSAADLDRHGAGGRRTAAGSGGAGGSAGGAGVARRAGAAVFRGADVLRRADGFRDRQLDRRRGGFALVDSAGGRGFRGGAAAIFAGVAGLAVLPVL